MTRKKNIYFDRKSMGFKLGKKPGTRRKRKRQSASERQDRQHAKIAERAARREETVERKRASAARAREARAQFSQVRSEAKKEARARELAKKDESLWRELYGNQNPARVFPGNLTDSERAALQKLVRRSHMATKKKRKRKKKNGKMPKGPAAYWRKKRAKKNSRKKRRARKPNTKRTRTRRRRTAMNPRPRRRVRRRARRNLPQKRRTLIIKSKFAKGTAGFKADVAAARAKYGKARVI